MALLFLDPSSLNQDYADDCHSNSVSFQTKERIKYKEHLQPLPFHSTHGKNVTLKRNRYYIHAFYIEY